MRLEGELETSKLREEAMAEKFKSSEKAMSELQQLRVKANAAESELDQTRRHVERLRNQISQQSEEGGSARAASLDQLRMELLSRIEAKAIVPERQPSILPPAQEEDGQRKTLMNQRELFEQLQQQFNDAQGSGSKDEMIFDAAAPDGGFAAMSAEREQELEEEIRRIRKENVELSIRMTNLQAELREKEEDAGQLLGNNSYIQAELEDLQLQVEKEATTARRQMAKAQELEATLLGSEGELSSLKRRVASTEDQLVRAEEEARSAAHRASQLEDEHHLFERQLQDMQARAQGAAQRERDSCAQVEEQRQMTEQARRAIEAAERARAESDSTASWLESENERLKVELNDANSERAKIRQAVDEMLSVQTEARKDELRAEADRWQRKAGHFEKEYQQAKQLNSEMTKVMTQMTQAVSERSDESSDLSRQHKALVKQFELKSQDLKAARLDRDEALQKLDTLQSSGSYYQDKYREVEKETRTLRQEHSVATATSSKLKMRLESIQQECEDLKEQSARVQIEARSRYDDSSRIGDYERQVKELQTKLRSQDVELDRSQAFASKSQAVNDCLNTLLVLESEQTSLYEMACPIKAGVLLVWSLLLLLLVGVVCCLLLWLLLLLLFVVVVVVFVCCCWLLFLFVGCCCCCVGLSY
ncbi:unnamed protein product [Polarella glacialis]|nr:unnamed protein product [Polarella glacialis]